MIFQLSIGFRDLSEATVCLNVRRREAKSEPGLLRASLGFKIKAWAYLGISTLY